MKPPKTIRDSQKKSARRCAMQLWWDVSIVMSKPRALVGKTSKPCKTTGDLTNFHDALDGSNKCRPWLISPFYLPHNSLLPEGSSPRPSTCPSATRCVGVRKPCNWRIRWGGTWGNQATHVEMWIKQWDLMDLMALNGILGEMGYCKTIYKAVLFRFHFKCLSCSVLMSTPRAQETKPWL